MGKECLIENCEDSVKAVLIMLVESFTQIYFNLLREGE